jgi:hypothetical protein
MFFSIAIARTARNCSHQKPNHIQCESKILRLIYVRMPRFTHYQVIDAVHLYLMLCLLNFYILDIDFLLDKP